MGVVVRRIGIQLAQLPNPKNEPILQELGKAIDRLVQAAHASICEDKINFFG
jgi:hypothetical protein